MKFMNTNAHQNNPERSAFSTVTRRSAFALSVGLLVTIGLSGCGNGAGQYEGAYTGSSGHTTLTLEKGGAANYSQLRDGSTDAGAGTWRIEDKTIFVITESLRDEIYADISNKPESLLFKSKGSSWNDEIFTKK